MNYYKTSQYTYLEFIKERGTNRLSKFEKLESNNPGTVKFLNIQKLDEIFDSRLDKLDYNKEITKHPLYNEEVNITYFFNSLSGNRYRLDLVTLIENNSNLVDTRLHDKKFISVSFSPSDSSWENYDEQTNRHEVYDLMKRIRFLIELNEYKTKMGYVFMFGKPDNHKFTMYKYFIQICFPDYKLVSDYTSGFPNTDIGYYLLASI